MKDQAKKVQVHDKYENELDELLKGDDNYNQDIKQDEVMNAEVSFGEDEEASESENDMETGDLQSISDRKKYLLEMLENNVGANKTQVFNFEDEDNVVTKTPDRPAEEKKKPKLGSTTKAHPI